MKEIEQDNMIQSRERQKANRGPRAKVTDRGHCMCKTSKHAQALCVQHAQEEQCQPLVNSMGFA